MCFAHLISLAIVPYYISRKQKKKGWAAMARGRLSTRNIWHMPRSPPERPSACLVGYSAPSGAASSSWRKLRQHILLHSLSRQPWETRDQSSLPGLHPGIRASLLTVATASLPPAISSQVATKLWEPREGQDVPPPTSPMQVPSGPKGS